MEFIYGASYQGRKVKKAHDYLRYDAPDPVRHGFEMLRTPVARPINTMRWLGYGAFVVAPYALAWKLPQSLWYVGVKGIDRIGARVIWGGGKLLHWASRNHTPDPTYNNLTGWLNWARPSRLRTVEGWTPYGFGTPPQGGVPVGQWDGWKTSPVAGWVRAGWGHIGTGWSYVEHPRWLGDGVALPGNGVALPERPAETFNPYKEIKGIKERSPELWTRYNQWISNAILQDAETIGRSILTERFPAGHVQAGQPRYAAFLPAFHAAQPNQVNLPLPVGFANINEAVTYRDAHMDHLLELNAMNMTNILQRDFERQEAQHVLKLILKMHRKELWYFTKYGYLGYEGPHKEQAKLAHGRLLGLLQEVDPLHGRKQGVPMSL